MKTVDIDTADIIVKQRLLQEILLCQELAYLYDKNLGEYMTILGRMGVVHLILEFMKIEETAKRKKLEAVDTYRKWLDAVDFVSTWAPIKWRKMTYEEFCDPDGNEFLQTGYPWGVVTLGGFFRAYAEFFEKVVPSKVGKIKKETPTDGPFTSSDTYRVETKDGKFIKGGLSIEDVQKEFPLTEDDGRLSWQRNLIESYGYDLFKKGQVSSWMKDAKDKWADMESQTSPAKDRMRFEKKIMDLSKLNKRQKEYYDLVKEIAPPWTKSGRVKWQTMTRDRISLFGDTHGMVRGATISGTTSDHMYAVFSLLNLVRNIVGDQRASYIPRLLSRKRAPYGAAFDDSLHSALEVIGDRTGNGYERVARMMSMIPIMQMGLELHHSVHEMGSVLSLNDMTEWSVGHYETLFIPMKMYEKKINELMKKHHRNVKDYKPTKKERELEKLRQSANKSKKISRLAGVEKEIHKKLEAWSKKVIFGIFKTIDPFIITGKWDEGSLAGCICTNNKEIRAHKDHAYVGRKSIQILNKCVARGWSGEVAAEYLNGHVRRITKSKTAGVKKLAKCENAEAAFKQMKIKEWKLDTLKKKILENNKKISSGYKRLHNAK